ncbi:SDR family NAD(P)-dependent oxidoreductase [Streptomyces sp. NPDC008312]|uniref:SDR family NAD(P)-dependent oxidoreductase n=1 Tax=Streptomyces sp. NPDC008312 TaxID=3364825 RepID=UPI0036E555F7
MSENRVVVLTGAARGIGRATAVAFAREGYSIAGADIAALVSSAMDYHPATPEDLAETGRLVREAGSSAWLPLVFDQRDRRAVKDGFNQVVEGFGGIDVVFANAGVQGFASLLQMSDELWDDQIDVNLTGTANVLRAAAPLRRCSSSAGADGSSSRPPPRVSTAPSTAQATRRPSGD